jgi:transcriptional regulator
MGGSDLFTGTLELLILRTVQETPLHGYAIGKQIRETTSGVLDLEEGALYPALHRLRKKGWLESEWRKTTTGRRAKFYGLTAEGARRLEDESERWAAFTGAVQAVLGRSGG